jgi:hypothetical protein
MVASAPTIGVEMETGIYIDGSHMSSTDFSIAVIRFAVANGLEIDIEQFEKDQVALEQQDLVDDDLLDILDAIDWTYEDAIDYLNDTAPEGTFWEVSDSSLYLTSEEEQLKLW